MKMLECEDVDECSLNVKYCGQMQCTNTIGTFSCGCSNGFLTTINQCVDIDECAFRTVVHFELAYFQLSQTRS